MHAHKSKLPFKLATLAVLIAFQLTAVLPPTLSHAQMLQALSLPAVGTMVMPSPGFVPTRLMGMTVHPDNPLQFDFIVDTGNTGFDTGEVRGETEKLVKYFLAAMTVPKSELWVNLSPEESDNIIPGHLGKTTLGRDMLTQDYLLKQLTASLIHPETELGEEFWRRVRKLTYERYGTTDIPMQTFNKVWVLPDAANVYEYENTVYITHSYLKVMMDRDYVAARVTKDEGHIALRASALRNSPERSEGRRMMDEKNTSAVSRLSSIGTPAQADLETEILREIIIPEIEKEVNEGKNFAPLRQIYHSLILAKWYKETIKDSLLSQIYIDRNKVAGVNVEDETIKQQIYDRYIDAYKKGVFSFIKEDYDTLSKDIIPRKYFSGGIRGDVDIRRDYAMVNERSAGDKFVVQVKAAPQGRELSDPDVRFHSVGIPTKRSERRDAAMAAVIDSEDTTALYDALSQATGVIAAVTSRDENGTPLKAPVLIGHSGLERFSNTAKIFIDISTDQGGNIVHPWHKFSHAQPAIADEYRHLHEAVPNMPAAMGSLASPYLASATQPYLYQIIHWLKTGEFEQRPDSVKSGISIIDERLIDEGAAKVHGITESAPLQDEYLNVARALLLRRLSGLNQVTVGVPKEIKNGERRVGITADEVRDLVENGMRVLIEAGAGVDSGITNEQYVKAGAHIVSQEQVWKGSHIIKKVKEPLKEEFEHIRERQVIFTYFHLANDGNKELIEELLRKKVTAIAYEAVTVNGKTPLLDPMSHIAGWVSAIRYALYYRQNNNYTQDVDETGVLKQERKDDIKSKLEIFTDFINEGENFENLRAHQLKIPDTVLERMGLERGKLGKVVILGGGQAGSEAAYMLNLLGVDVVVSERSAQRRNYLAKELTDKVLDDRAMAGQANDITAFEFALRHKDSSSIDAARTILNNQHIEGFQGLKREAIDEIVSAMRYDSPFGGSSIGYRSKEIARDVILDHPEIKKFDELRRHLITGVLVSLDFNNPFGGNYYRGKIISAGTILKHQEISKFSDGDIRRQAISVVKTGLTFNNPFGDDYVGKNDAARIILAHPEIKEFSQHQDDARRMIENSISSFTEPIRTIKAGAALDKAMVSDGKKFSDAAMANPFSTSSRSMRTLLNRGVFQSTEEEIRRAAQRLIELGDTSVVYTLVHDGLDAGSLFNKFGYSSNARGLIISSQSAKVIGALVKSGDVEDTNIGYARRRLVEFLNLMMRKFADWTRSIEDENLMAQVHLSEAIELYLQALVDIGAASDLINLNTYLEFLEKNLNNPDLSEPREAWVNINQTAGKPFNLRKRYEEYIAQAVTSGSTPRSFDHYAKHYRRIEIPSVQNLMASQKRVLDEALKEARRLYDQDGADAAMTSDTPESAARAEEVEDVELLISQISDTDMEVHRQYRALVDRLTALGATQEQLTRVYEKALESKSGRVRRNAMSFFDELRTREVTANSQTYTLNFIDKRIDYFHIEFLRPIIEELVRNELGRGYLPDSAAIDISRLQQHASITDSYFITWGAKEYIVGISMEERHNKHVKRQERMLAILNPQGKREQLPLFLLAGEAEEVVYIDFNGNKITRKKAYVVVNKLPGKQLETQLNKNEDTVITFALDLARLVQRIHKNSVIVRDIKPGNILVEDGQFSGLFDFNVSISPDYDWANDPDELKVTNNSIFADDMVVLPQLTDIESRRKPDQQTDIYSVGMVMVFAVAGREYTAAHVKQPHNLLNAIKNNDLRAIIQRAIAPRGERYETIGALIQDLERLFTDRAMMNGKIIRRTLGAAVLGVTLTGQGVMEAAPQATQVTSPEQFMAAIREDILLFDAFVNEDVDYVQARIEAGFNVNEVYVDFTPLISAVRLNLTKIVRLLLENGADPNILGGNRSNALLLAINSDQTDPEIIRLLLEYGADPNYRNEQGLTPLIVAAFQDRVEGAGLLLRYGAEVDLPYQEDTTPLFIASMEGNTRIGRALVDSNADLNAAQRENGMTALMSAAREGHIEFVEMMLDAGARIDLRNITGRSAIFMAIIRGDLGIVNLLIERGANVNMIAGDRQTVLMAAAFYLNTDIIRAILDAGADINILDSNGMNVLGRVTLARALGVLTGQDPNFDIIDTVRLLLERDVNVDVLHGDRPRTTPIILAAQGMDSNVVRLLLEHGAPVNGGGSFDTSPLIMAAQNGDLETARVLINMGANVNLKTLGGRETALRVARKGGHTEMVKLLISSGADEAMLGDSIIFDSNSHATVAEGKKLSDPDVRFHSVGIPTERSERRDAAMAAKRVAEFDEKMASTLSGLQSHLGSPKVIVGVPYYREEENIGPLTRQIRSALAGVELDNEAAIVVIGEYAAQGALGAVLDEQDSGIPVFKASKPEGFRGKPFSERAFMQLAKESNAVLVSIDADTDPELAKDWIGLLTAPILSGEADIVLPHYARRFDRDDGAVHVFDYLIGTSVYGMKIHQRHGGEFALSPGVVKDYLDDPGLQYEGVCCAEGQIAARAVLKNHRIAEANLGIKWQDVEPEKISQRMSTVLKSVFDDTLSHLPQLKNLNDEIQEPVVLGEPIGQEMEVLFPESHQRYLYRQAAQGIAEHYGFYGDLLSGEQDILDKLRSLTDYPSMIDIGQFTFSPEHWAELTRRFFVAYSIAYEARKQQLVEAFVPIWQAAMADFYNRVQGKTYEEAMQILDDQYLPAFRSRLKSAVSALSLIDSKLRQGLSDKAMAGGPLIVFDPNPRASAAEFTSPQRLAAIDEAMLGKIVISLISALSGTMMAQHIREQLYKSSTAGILSSLETAQNRLSKVAALKRLETGGQDKNYITNYFTVKAVQHMDILNEIENTLLLLGISKYKLIWMYQRMIITLDQHNDVSGIIEAVRGLDRLGEKGLKFLRERRESLVLDSRREIAGREGRDFDSQIRRLDVAIDFLAMQSTGRDNAMSIKPGGNDMNDTGFSDQTFVALDPNPRASAAEFAGPQHLAAIDEAMLGGGKIKKLFVGAWTRYQLGQAVKQLIEKDKWKKSSNQENTARMQRIMQGSTANDKQALEAFLNVAYLVETTEQITVFEKALDKFGATDQQKAEVYLIWFRQGFDFFADRLVSIGYAQWAMKNLHVTIDQGEDMIRRLGGSDEDVIVYYAGWLEHARQFRDLPRNKGFHGEEYFFAMNGLAQIGGEKAIDALMKEPAGNITLEDHLLALREAGANEGKLLDFYIDQLIYIADSTIPEIHPNINYERYGHARPLIDSLADKIIASDNSRAIEPLKPLMKDMYDQMRSAVDKILKQLGAEHLVQSVRQKEREVVAEIQTQILNREDDSLIKYWHIRTVEEAKLAGQSFQIEIYPGHEGYEAPVTEEAAAMSGSFAYPTRIEAAPRSIIISITDEAMVIMFGSLEWYKSRVNHKNPLFRLKAIKVLGEKALEESVDLIAGALNDSDAAVRNEAEKYLTYEQIVNTYISMLPNDYAIKRLGELKSKKALSVLESLLASTPATREVDVGPVGAYDHFGARAPVSIGASEWLTEVPNETYKLILASIRNINSEGEDSATLTEVGGIDMNSIDVNRQSEGVKIRFKQEGFESLLNMPIDGFAPVIINVIPLPSVLPLLGLQPRREDDYLRVSKLSKN